MVIKVSPKPFHVKVEVLVTSKAMNDDWEIQKVLPGIHFYQKTVKNIKIHTLFLAKIKSQPSLSPYLATICVVAWL